jgi:hypothetical protein
MRREGCEQRFEMFAAAFAEAWANGDEHGALVIAREATEVFEPDEPSGLAVFCAFCSASPGEECRRSGPPTMPWHMRTARTAHMVRLRAAARPRGPA